MRGYLILNRFLHLYAGCKRKVIIEAGDGITDFSVCRQHASSVWRVLILCAAHDVYLIDVPDTESPNVDISDDKTKEGNQSIFSDLLDKGEDGEMTVVPFCESVIHLNSRHMVLQSDCPIKHIDVVRSLLLTLSSGLVRKIRAYDLDNFQNYSQGNNNPTFEIKCPSLQFDSEKDKLGLHVLVSSVEDPDKWMSTDAIQLHQTLFTALFKTEAALLHSPIILFTLNGCVFCHQIKTLLCGALWEILCDIEGSIESITKLQVKPKDDGSDLPFTDLQPQVSKCSEGLLVCSSTGKTVLVHIKQPEGGVVYDILTLPGPVVCCAGFQSTIYHSTGKQIFGHVVMRCNNPTKGGNSVDIKSDLLHQSFVQRLAVDGESLDSTGIKLVCQSALGDILVLSGQSDPNSKPLAYMAHSFEELLMGLDTTNKRHADIFQKQSQLNDLIHQLSIAGHLITNNSLKSETLTKNDVSHPVSCSCSVTSTRNGYKVDYSLICKLTNDSSISLSCDWSLMVVLVTKNPSHTESRSHGMALSHGLKSGSCLEMRVPMDMRCLSSLYCDVKVYLVLYSDLLGDQMSFKLNAPVPKTSSLGLPALLKTQRLDILYYLREPITEVVNSTITKCKKPGSSFVSQEPMRKQWNEEEVSSSKQMLTTEICVGRVKLPTDFESRCQEGDSMCVKLLKYLLQDSQINVEAIKKGHLHLADPCGHVVSVSMAADPQRSGDRLSVKLGCSSVEVLARCRAAIVHRIKTVCCPDETDLCVKDLRQYLTKLESIKDEIRSLEEQAGRDSESSNTIRNSLSSVYEKLRKIQL
ncbi:Fanconi anemia core complex-associated protein 100-like [Haliotis asinina]|uniref:Fanconi anemia core complex-associated protein 100-like n=1 Tax=Haliotis asinina TaxID=109174 RepID=UPI00353211B8